MDQPDFHSGILKCPSSMKTMRHLLFARYFGQHWAEARTHMLVFMLFALLQKIIRL
jgi:hypothetical protein